MISKIQKLAGRIFSKKLKDNDIDFNSAQGRILFVLWKEDNLKIQELAEKTSLSKTSLTSMLERLENQGHITREQSTSDRRSTIIKLTEKNKALQSVYESISTEMTELFYTGFTEQEIDLFEVFLNRIIDNLKKKK